MGGGVFPCKEARIGNQGTGRLPLPGLHAVNRGGGGWPPGCAGRRQNIAVTAVAAIPSADVPASVDGHDTPSDAASYAAPAPMKHMPSIATIEAMATGPVF